jgi:hypothetical protein
VTITLSDLTNFPSEGNSWVAGYIFSAEEFCTVAVLQESKTYATEKSDVHQGCQVLCAYLVDILWFAVDQFRISVFYCRCFGLECTYVACFLLHLKVMVLWRVQFVCLPVMDIIVNCLFRMWHNPSVFVQDVVERD